MKSYPIARLCLVLIFTVCASMAVARTWTDSAGTHKIEGEFVTLADGKVEIRRNDGKLLRVALEKLSEEDQKYVRKRATPANEGPLAVSDDEAKPSVNPIGPVAGGDTQTVFAEGVGTTKEEALKDAFRAAVRQVVGEVVNGETIVENEELVKDQVLTYSDGFIPEHKVTSEKHDNGLFRIGIRAKVQRRSVIMKLKGANITLKSVDGQSLYGSIVTQIGAEKDAVALVAKVLEGFPDNYLEARVVGEPETLTKSDSEATLVINVEFAPSQAAYKTFATKLCHTLEGSCKMKGEFTTELAKERAQGGEYFYFHSNFVQITASTWMPELLNNQRWIAKEFVFAVATLVSRDFSRVNWNYYVLDETVGKTVVRAVSREVTCKLSLVDADGHLVSVERFDPRNDPIPDLKDDRLSQANPWRCFLRGLWVQYGQYVENSPIFPVEPSGPSTQWEPRLVFVAPLLFGKAWGNNLCYVPNLTIPRKVKLSLDELKRVAKVKCELTFRAGSDDQQLRMMPGMLPSAAPTSR
jgi:hypothetical protein